MLDSYLFQGANAMRNVKTLTILSILFLLSGGFGNAAFGLTSESEPNGDCATANLLAIGDVVDAAIDPAGDWDYYELSVDAGVTLHFHTILDEGAPGALGDTKMQIFADDCTTSLGFSDDVILGVDLRSSIILEFATARTCFVRIWGFPADATGTYQLVVEDYVEPLVEGDTCGAPYPISGGAFEINSTTEGMANDYEMTNYHPEGSPDVVYGITLPAGANFSCDLEGYGVDFVLCLVTDCSDPEGSLVVFSDNDPEFIDYTNETGASQDLFLILDGFEALDSSGSYTLTGNNGGSGLVATDACDWGSLKSMFR